MIIEFTCENCGQRHKVTDEYAGRRARCKKCRHLLRVPSIFDEEFPRETTAGGSVVHRHEPRTRGFELAVGDDEALELIKGHVEQFIGPIEMVFREIVSDMIHVDVHWVQPTPERPYHTFITSGMSDRPMAVPARLKNDARFAELMISLPPHWPISEADFGDERNYWPIRWLKILARFPHEYETWLFQSHTVPHGDPPEPFAPNTQFCGWLVLPPLLLPKEFRLLRVSPAKEIHFFAIYPIYKDEMKFKLDYGVDALVDRFVEHDVCEIVDVDRRNVCNIC